MDEVGKRASIFDKADPAHLWLNRIHTVDLARYMVRLGTMAQSAERLGNTNEPCIHSTDWLDSAIELFQSIQANPWFSSLGTVQEACVRKDAVLLSPEGESVSSSTPDEVTVFDIARYSYTVYSEIMKHTLAPIQPDRHDAERARTLVDILLQSGLPTLNSSNAIIRYSVARFRRTRHPRNRIYGITQIYGILFGESAQPGTSCTLDE